MNVVLKLEAFLSVEYVLLKECDQFFMAHPVRSQETAAWPVYEAN